MSFYAVFFALLLNFPDDLPPGEPNITITTGTTTGSHDGEIDWELLQQIGISAFSQQSTSYAGIDSEQLSSIVTDTVGVRNLLYSVEVDAEEYGFFTLYYAYDPQNDIKVVIVDLDFFVREKSVTSLESGVVGIEGTFGGGLNVTDPNQNQEKVVVMERDGQTTVLSPDTNSHFTGQHCRDQLTIEKLLRDLLPNTGFEEPVAFEEDFFFNQNCAEFKLLEFLRQKLIDGEFRLEQEDRGVVFQDGDVFDENHDEAREHVLYIREGLLSFLSGRLNF